MGAASRGTRWGHSALGPAGDTAVLECATLGLGLFVLDAAPQR
jgi:hypothetical protein